MSFLLSYVILTEGRNLLRFLASLGTTQRGLRNDKGCAMNFCRRDILIAFILAIATLAVYWQMRDYEFINYDDGSYIYNNPPVMKGLTPESIAWAFAAAHSGNWHPLTWLSHIVDVQLFGNNPGYHHLTNVMFHIANTVLLFFVLLRMTGEVWKSSFVAALFALHPLHVESVAWVSERKDVLSAFFAFLTLGSYAQYVKDKSRQWYLAALLFFILGQMSKPMIVTLPFVLLLLDYWTLKRLNNIQFSILNSQFSILSEKLPFFFFTALSSVVTFFVQKSAGAVGSLNMFSLDIRIGNALVSYTSYIGKMFCPSHLAVFYPHPGAVSVWKITVAAILLIFISLLAISARKRYPYVLIGWLWYLGTLVPVIGLVQVGSQAMADRYSYIPIIGLFIIIAWGIPDMLLAWRYKKTGLALAAAVIISILTVMTQTQVGYWKNSFTLFKHALAVTSDNYIAHRSVGDELFHQGKTDEAIRHYRETLRISPNYAQAYHNLGAALFHKGKIDEAIIYFQEALRLEPDLTGAHKNLSQILTLRTKRDTEIAKIQAEFQDDPNHPKLYCNIGNVYKFYGESDKAVEQYQKALSVQPEFTEALNLTAIAYAGMGKYDNALSLLKKSLSIQPKSPDACYYIACIFARQKKTEDAVFWLKEAVRHGFKNWNLLKVDDNLINIKKTEYYKQLIAD